MTNDPYRDPGAGGSSPDPVWSRPGDTGPAPPPEAGQHQPPPEAAQHQPPLEAGQHQPPPQAAQDQPPAEGAQTPPTPPEAAPPPTPWPPAAVAQSTTGPQPPGYPPPPPYQAYPPPPYPAQPGGAPPAPGGRRTNALAVVALVCSLAGVFTLVSAPVGAILGHVAIGQIRQSGEEGGPLATVAIWVGWIITGLIVAVACAVFVLVVTLSRTT